MKIPKFLKEVRKTEKARAIMAGGTKFLNTAIPKYLTPADCRACLVIAHEQDWSRGARLRIHGICIRRQSYEERDQIL